MVTLIVERSVPAEVLRRDFHGRCDFVPMRADEIPARIFPSQFQELSSRLVSFFFHCDGACHRYPAVLAITTATDSTKGERVSYTPLIVARNAVSGKEMRSTAVNAVIGDAYYGKQR